MKPLDPRIRRIAAVLAVAAAPLAAACAPLHADPSPRCGAVGGQPQHAIQLLFGRAIGTQGEVSEAQWRAFLAAVVTPAFPDGLTVLEAQGQWRDTATGALVSEPSKVVLLVVPDAAAAMPRVKAVVAAYKRQFSQQSVAVVTTPACTAFL
jgi:hypothetical protein